MAFWKGRPRLEAEGEDHPVIAVIAKQYNSGKDAERGTAVGS
jgi:hypothetical protein